ncbi:VIR protein [Plasmodium vivax]|uniref:VIR protein n=1 Tax=Plasmodium vivax TaxID=5855 RepID=A0A1G4ECH6_PLAVI|nr:VIR protein [Plasmodium vivax]
MSGTGNSDWDELDVLRFSREKELISRKFYDKLENDFKLTDYDEHCGTFDKPVHHKHVRHVCATVLNYLKYNNDSDNDKNVYSICKLLNYWAYSKLNDLYGSMNETEIEKAFSALEKIWMNLVHDRSRKEYFNKCKPDIILFSYTDWKQRKELYDYYVDILPISIYPKIYTNDCDEYYKYIKYKKKIYDKYDVFCKDLDDIKCPNFFEKCKNYNPKDILPQFNCYQDMKKKEEELAAVQEVQKGSLEFTPSSGAENSDSSVPIAKKAGNALLGVVVTSMTSGALYKFTPLGGMIRSGLGWNNNNMGNINGGNNGFYNYASEAFNPYSGGEEHYIGYHPAQ